ncbi:hypothetical protein [Fluviicola sp.]|uniref:hypothetical protein n=1 Tax=Fluviicola sp. TaxID=1917219 RepID=UPI003D2C1E9D
MEANYPPEELFSKAYSRFYDSLKKRYQIGIEKATDKDYAQDYYCRTLFAENTMIPRYSVFFYSLISTFTHYQKIGDDNPFESTLVSLSAIQEMTSTIIEQTLIIQASMSERLYQLNWLYLQAIEERNTSVLELIDTEQRLLKYTDDKIILILAFHHATQTLNEEFSKKKDGSNQPLSIEPLMEGQQIIESKLTRSQQVLIAYYILQLIGVNHKKNVSKCANALHSFLGVPYTQITHSELYKKLLHPLTFSSGEATFQNLLIVRSFFESLGSISATNLIDSDIENIKKSK